MQYSTTFTLTIYIYIYIYMSKFNTFTYGKGSGNSYPRFSEGNLPNSTQLEQPSGMAYHCDAKIGLTSKGFVQKVLLLQT